MTAVHRAMAQLGTWPNLVSGRPQCAVGHAFATAEYDVVHFHSEDAADVHLTRTAVERLWPHLRHNSAIRVIPGAAWITVLLDCDADVELLLSLVSVALKAHAGSLSHQASTPCDWERSTIPGERAASLNAVSAVPPHGVFPAARRAVGRLMPNGH